MKRLRPLHVAWLAAALLGACATAAPAPAPAAAAPAAAAPAAAPAAPAPASDPSAETDPRTDGGQVVPQAMLEGQRIAGSKVLALPDPVLARLHRARKRNVHVKIKMCIDETGAPSRIALLEPTGDAEGDAALQAGLSEWRYRPYVVHGQPVAVCFHVIYNYKIRR